MSVTYLDFEQPRAALDARVDGLRDGPRGPDVRRELRRLAAERRRLERDVYDSLSPWQRVLLARHVDRPQTLDYVGRLCRDFVELRGDRACGDDAAIVAGVGLWHGTPLAIVGHQRGHTTAERVHHNFGMANPEGYRKAIRVFRLAERLGIPILTLVDTQGAYPGVGAEERGQAEAIAVNLREMAALQVPVIITVIGEGGSGGALALGVGDRVIMLEHAVYSVISPEGCAAILWKSSAAAPDAASAMKITAQDLKRLGVIDEIVPEPDGGAHADPAATADLLAPVLERALKELQKLKPAQLIEERYKKFRRMGVFEK